MEKKYQKPTTQVANVIVKNQILAGTGGPSGAPARATNAGRSDYGEATPAW